MKKPPTPSTLTCQREGGGGREQLVDLHYHGASRSAKVLTHDLGPLALAQDLQDAPVSPIPSGSLAANDDCELHAVPPSLSDIRVHTPALERSQAIGEKMAEERSLQVVKHKAFPVDPVAAGRKGVQAREAKVMDNLTSTRQYVNSLAQPAAEYMGALLDAEVVSGADQLKVTVARDILDRTIGKAAQELRIGPADQTLDILKELDEDTTT